jgi:N-acetylneuraminate synthase
MAAGEVLKLEDLAYKKPGNGIGAEKYRKVVGKSLSRTMKADEQILWKDLVEQ